jgi:prophage DNA circulation protein
VTRWASAMHQASYGGVEFDCLTTRDSIARALARRVYPRRNGGHVQDMGAEPRTTQVQAIFFERNPLDGETAKNHHVRFAAFFEASQRGIAQDFVHPLTGRYRAAVESFDFEATGEEDDVILADVTFVEDTTEPAVFEPGIGAPLDAGTAAVRVQAELLEEELDTAGLTSTIPSMAIDLTWLWESEPFLVLREVNLALASFGSAVNDAMDELELVTSLARFPIWRSMQRLLYTVRLAAEAFRQDQPQLTIILVLRGQPLRALVAEHYGARDAERRYQELIRLNDIDDPSYIQEGTRLHAPVADADRRSSPPSRAG